MQRLIANAVPAAVGRLRANEAKVVKYIPVPADEILLIGEPQGGAAVAGAERPSPGPPLPAELPPLVKEQMPHGPPPLGSGTPSPKDAPEPLRKWTDVSGHFSVEARFLGLAADDGQVELQRADGTRVKVPLQRLSGKDIVCAVKRHLEKIGENASPKS